MFEHGLIVAVLLLAALPFGCQKPAMDFPLASSDALAKDAGALKAYDANHSGKADFFVFADASGRITRIGYDTTGTGKPDEIVPLETIPFSRCRHLVLILDGFSYDVIKRYYDSGHLRFFYPPSRVIAPYPTLTDPCIEDALGYIRPPAMEGQYYSHKLNQVVGGAIAYLHATNEPYDSLLQYRAKLIWDGIAYLYPWPVFVKEINDCKRLFDQHVSQEFMAYYVSSAAVGTRQGWEGQTKCLEKVDCLINQVMYESHGLTQVTMFADHGHTYTRATRIPLEDYLQKKSWHVTDKLKNPNDVVYIRFGLETYAAFWTHEPAKLAADLAAATGVQLASYAQGDKVIVLSKDGKATISHEIEPKGGAAVYSYKIESGDPLKLKPTLATLSASGQYSDDFPYDTDRVFAATVTHYYPAPLERLWRAHFGLVQNPPDVIVSLEDNYYSGAKGFAGAVDIASTHGGLDAKNSTTFIMSTAGPLPPFMRSAEIPANMKKLTGADFPMRK